MAIQWGNSINNFRLGLDIVGSTWILYGQSLAYGHNWSYTITFGGDASGTKTGHFQSDYGKTVTRELHRWTAPNVTQTNTARLVSVLVNGAYVARTLTVTPKPSAPRVDRVIRNSDTSHRIEWTRYATATSVRVERRTNGGAWTHVGSVSSNAANFTDTSTKAGNRYQWRVRVANAGGTSDWSNLSNTVYTTPPAPTGVTATRVGNNIRVNGSMPENSSHLDIQDGATTLVSALAKGALPWTHSSPSQVETHRYRMRSRVASGADGNATLYSGWSAYSSTVQLTAPPNAPTGVRLRTSPGASDDPGFLQYQHNPVDSSEISGLRFRYRGVGQSEWTQSPNVTAASVLTGDYPFTASRWADMWALTDNGARGLEFQVSTRGAHPDWSPWSATAVMEIVTRPIVTISSPEPGVLHDARLSVLWEFFQAEDRPQSSWRARLLRDGSVVETRNGSGATYSVMFRTLLENESAYVIEVEAATGDVWSVPDDVGLDVSFILPVPGDLAGAWNDSAGAMELEVTADAWRRGVAREASGHVFVDF